MIRALAFCLALAACPAGAQSTGQNWGQNGGQNSGLERLTRPDQVTSWKAVGRVDLDGRLLCTGTLIAADLVLTAAHCLFDADGMALPVERLTFRAGLADGVAVAEAQVARATAHARYDPAQTGLKSAAMLRHDGALLQLASPISTALAPPFAVDSPGAGDKVSVVSYAQGRDAALSWQRACTVLGRQQGLIAVDCDVTFGASGAPVFDRSRGRARIVSIISAGRQEDGQTIAFGMELPTLVAELKAQLRAGRAVIAAQGALPAPRRIGAGAFARPTTAAPLSERRVGGARFVRAPGQ